MGVKSFGYTSVDDDNKLGFIGKVKGRRRRRKKKEEKKKKTFNTKIRLKYTPFWPFCGAYRSEEAPEGGNVREGG